MTENKPKGTPKWKWWEDPVIIAFAIILGVIVVCGIVYFYKLAYESGREADARSAYDAYKTKAAQARIDADRLTAAVLRMDPQSNLIGKARIQGDGSCAEFTMTNSFHVLHYQYRLQAAQGLYSIWRNIRSGRFARMSLVDYNGNEVGGTSWCFSVWVQKQ